MLLIDVGNTHYKWRQGDGPVQRSTSVPDSADTVAVAVSSAPERLAALEARLPVRLLGRELAVPDCGQYAGCGADRVLAGIAAVAATRADVLVIDAGTATTLTVWRADPSARCGAVFAGGLIAPGATACVAGLVARAPHLPAVAPSAPDADPAAASTADAIARAVGIGYPGLVARCCEQLAAATGVTTVVATGGGLAACALADVPVISDLVLRGLAQVVANSDSAAGSGE